MATTTVTDRAATSAEVARALRGRRVDLGGRSFQFLLLSSLVLALLILVVLLVDVFSESATTFRERGWDFLTSNLSRSANRAGVSQGIVGTLLLCLLVAVLSFPIGIGAAIYLEEYAPNTRFTNFIRVNIRNLAGVPSIVYGLLGLAIFVNLLFDRQQTLFAGGLTLAVLVLSIVIITSSEALRAVPSAIREAAYGVGATRWEVIRHHVLPYALPGILTGTILSIARAAGETAPLILVGATTGFLATSGGFLSQFTEKFTALPAIVFAWAKVPQTSFRTLTAAAIVVLLLLVLIVNAAAILLRNRYERKW